MAHLELRSHQTKAVDLARTKKNIALFYAAGTGKTATIARILADDFNAHKRIRRTLIFAPLIVCKQWPEEIKKFTKIPEERMHVLTESGKKRAERLEKIIALNRGEIVVTNYEAVQIKEVYEKLLRFSPDIVVLDESHRIKDSQAKRSKAVYPLCAAAERKFILTGTPAPNSLLDLFGQFKALDSSIFGGGFWSFRSRYFYDRNAGRKFSYPDWVPHPWAAKEIGEKLKEHSLQVTREECLDLPPLSVIRVPCELSKSQASVYKEMKKEFVAEFGGEIMSTDFEMVKTLRMQQILAGFIQPDEKEEAVWFDDVPRLDALMQVIESIGKQKIILWTTFRPTYKKISERLTEAGIPHTFLTGEQVGDSQKQENKKLFTEGDAQVLIANPAAAGEGIDGLQCAKYAIYYMRSYSLLHHEQSLARNYRGGSEQHDKVIHYHLYSKGTVDEVVMEALMYKKSVQADVLSWARGDINLDTSMGMGHTEAQMEVT